MTEVRTLSIRCAPLDDQRICWFCRKAVPPRLSRYDRDRSGNGASTVVDFKGSHFERVIVLWGVRWYVAYPISYRQLEEMMEERGEEVDHTTLNRWVLKYVAQHSP